MEALTALSLASNIVQFIDFSNKIIKGAKEIHDSATGTLSETESLEDVVKEMQSLSLRLDPPTTGNQNEDERAFRRLAGECRILCTQLLDLINSIKPNNPKSKRQSIRAAIRETWSKKERIELERRLNSCRDQLELQLTFLMNSQTKETLALLSKDLTGGLPLLTQLKQHVKQLQEGVKVTSISVEAQEQLRNLLGLSQSACISHAQRHILDCLAFKDMHSRFEAVNKAHSSSFLWVFDDEMYKEPASVEEYVVSSCNDYVREAERRFLWWLSSGDGIFHIAGKLGSGKSTLMKFLCEHPHTILQLEKWAGEKQLIFAHFFFWKPGTTLQKSLNGLFRSLVYKILEACPELIPTALPRQWNEVINPLQLQAPTNLKFGDETIRAAFEKLVTSQNIHLKHRFCFFIDGLDEYEETRQLDYLAMTKLLQDWTSASSGNVKICVSSREYNVFEKAFSVQKRIRLQDLTRADMKRYTEDMLQDISSQDDRRHLAQRIVDRADGIFLWVALVVKSIREVLDESQDLTTLEQELEALPMELELLFHHLLCSIRISARSKGYLLFKLVPFFTSYFQEELPLLTCLFIEEYVRNPQFAIQSSASYMYSEMDITTLQNLATRRLNGYCKGLLEARNGREGKCITITHRSIKEFFQKPTVRAEIEPGLGEITAGAAIPQLLLAVLRWAEHKPIDKVKWAFWVCNMMRLEVLNFPNPEKDAYDFLDCLDLQLAEKIEKSSGEYSLNKTALIRTPSRAISIGWSSYDTNGNFSVTSTLLIAATLGQFGYVTWRISQPQPLLEQGLEMWVFLIWALKFSGLFHEKELLDPIEATIREELKVLCWKKFILFVMQYHSKFTASLWESQALGELVELFVTGGAQLNISLSGVKMMEIANKKPDVKEDTTTDIHDSEGLSPDNPTQGESFEFCTSYVHGGTDKIKSTAIVEGSMFCFALHEGRMVAFKEMIELWNWRNKEEILNWINIEHDSHGEECDSLYKDELHDLWEETDADVSEPEFQSLPIILQNSQLQSQTQLFTLNQTYIATFLLGGLLSFMISYILK